MSFGTLSDDNLLCPLTRCILEGNEDALMHILRERTKNPTPLQVERRGWTVLHFAAFNDEHADCFKLLLSNKNTLELNLDAENNNGETALFLACAEGCFNNCRILLESQCNPEIRNGWGYTPLHIASTSGHANIVSQLIAHGLDPNCLTTPDKSTPLHGASRRGNLDVVRVLMTSKRTEVNIRNTSGQLPLHYACQNGFLEIVRILVEADRGLINVRCNQGRTPLINAVCYGHVECVKYLLDQKANANLCTVRHKTAIRYAFDKCVGEIPELVLQATCAKYIGEQSKLEIQEFLSKHGGVLHSLVSSAIFSSSPESVLLLIESRMPKCVLETPFLHLHFDGVCDVYSPLAYLFYAARLYSNTRDNVDKHLRLLLQHKITHLYEFSQMVELKGVRTETVHYVHPFTNILEGPWLSMQRDHYLNTLFEYGITTDYCLECDVHYNNRFRDFDVNVLERFYKPVVWAMQQDNAEFIELLLVNSAILEPFHLWNFLQYQHRRPVTIQRENPQNVVNYFIDLGIIVDTPNLPWYPSGGTIKCPNLQQLCRQAIRKHLRDLTVQDNLKNFKQKINALPLPNLLKNYLNFKRR